MKRNLHWKNSNETQNFQILPLTEIYRRNTLKTFLKWTNFVQLPGNKIFPNHFYLIAVAQTNRQHFIQINHSGTRRLFFTSLLFCGFTSEKNILNEFANPTLLLNLFFLFLLLLLLFVFYLTSPLTFFLFLSQAIIQTMNMIITSLHQTKCIDK